MVRALQVWNLTNCKLRANLPNHEGYINTVTVSPDGSLCASGGKVRCSRLSLAMQPGCPAFLATMHGLHPNKRMHPWMGVRFVWLEPGRVPVSPGR